MKQLLLMIAAAVAITSAAKTQCLTHVKYTAGKMEVYDSTMTLTESRDAQFEFETTDKGFTAVPEGNMDDALHGTLKKLTCQWDKPFVNGKIIMLCDVDDNHEHIEGATITIEAIDSKITVTMHAPKEYPNRIIRVIVDKYEEIK